LTRIFAPRASREEIKEVKEVKEVKEAEEIEEVKDPDLGAEPGAEAELELEEVAGADFAGEWGGAKAPMVRKAIQ